MEETMHQLPQGSLLWKKWNRKYEHWWYIL